MKFKVVLAEDNRLERKNIKFVLDSIEECEIAAEFSNGGEAFDYLLKNKADILLTDIKMPEMDGITLIQRLYEKNIDIEKIIISGYSDFEQAREIMGYDVTKYVLKPLVDNELEEAVLNVIKKRKLKYEKENKHNMMLRQIESVRPILLDNFFRNLILRPYNDKDYLKKQEKLLKINLFEKKITIATISVLKTNETDDVYEFSALVSELSDMDSDEIKYYPVIMNEKEIAVVMLHCVQSSEIISQMIEIKNKIIEKYEIDLLVGISQSVKNTDIVNLLYNQSRMAIQNARNTQKNVVIAYDKNDGNDANKVDYDLFLYTLQSGVKNVIKTNDENKIREFISEYIGMQNSEAWYRNFINCYVNILEVILNEHSESFEKIIGRKNVWQTLSDYDHIIDIEQYLFNLTSGVMHVIHQPSEYEIGIVEQVKELIAERFYDKLSVKDIANDLNFSRQHLHRIFSKVAGESILEYIIRYRVEKSKELLERGMSVNLVAEKVGYGDVGYFKKVFKDYTNMSINEFIDKKDRKEQEV